jgi:hypothetical protein
MNHGEHGENFGEKRELTDCDESLIDSVLTAATNVNIYLGPGLLESVYEAALIYELPKTVRVQSRLFAQFQREAS